MRSELHNSLAEQIYFLLKDKILSGELKSGMPISEEAIASQFGVSRTPIREALRRLAEYGLVTLKPHSNARVCSIDEKQARDIVLVRYNLESMAIDNLKDDLFKADFLKLSKIVADCNIAQANGERGKVLELDSLFHSTLIGCSDNSALSRIYELMDSQFQLVRFVQCPKEEHLNHYIAQHNLILQSILVGNFDECKKILREHITHDLD